MRVVAVDSRLVRWAIEARGAARGRSERVAVIVELRDEAGHVALGEAAPLPGMSRDSVADVEVAVAALRVPFDVGKVAGAMAIAESASPAASFAIATALLGLIAQREGISVGDLIAVSATVALAAVVDDVDEAHAAVARGIRCLKVKLGGGDGDLARVTAIAALPGVRLRLDANRAWPLDEAAERLAAFAGLPIDFIEEPCRDAYRLLDRRLALPIALDESLGELTENQLAAALRSPGLAALVLKPTLLGLAHTLALAGRARAAGVAVVVTHALEGPVGTAMCAEVARAIGTAAAGVAPHAALAGFAAAVPQLAEATVHAAGPGLGFGDLTLATLCDPLTITRDDRPAILGAVSLTFTQCAARLPAPEASIIATPTVDTLLAIYAALAARTPIALHHHRLASDELERRRALLARATLPADTAVVLFTSGSTGDARGVVLSRAALVAAAQANAAHLGWRPDDRWLLALSLAHAGGLAVAIRCLAARMPLVLAPELEPALLAEATIASLVPTQLVALLDDPRWRPHPRLRAVLLGGAPATRELLERARGRGVPVLVTYGMTETFGQVATAPLVRAGDPAAPLVALPGITLRATAELSAASVPTPGLATPAPIRVRGPMLATCYLDGTPIAPEHVTSDLGYLADGVLHVVGRADDTIISGGENVHPAQIEEVLAATHGVRAACVFGVPDPRWGQVVAAALEIDASFDTLAATARWHAALAPHARPRRLAITEALPRLPTGKLDRRAAAALAGTAIEY